MSATAGATVVEESFAGERSIRLANGCLSVHALLESGPRIVGLTPREGENLLAVLPSAALEVPGGGPYRLRGGHRLWAAPEVAAVTYRPDDHPVEVEARAGAMVLRGPVDAVTGLRRQVDVTLPDDGPTVVVDHLIENLGRPACRSRRGR